MTWLNPAGAWWLLLVPVLGALYMLRPQPVRRVVSSLRLWQNLPRVERPRARLRRPPLSLLMLLQGGLLAAGAVALIQPALTDNAGRHIVILLDASGSMAAVDGGRTRFAAAQAAARDLLGTLGPGSVATLVRVGGTVQTICAACPVRDVQGSLATLTPGAGRADWPAAFAVASGLAQRAGGARVESVIISDGAFPPVLADPPPASRFVQVGGPLDNRGIVAFSAARPPEGSPGFTAYARVENPGRTAATVDVQALADTVPLPPRRLDLPAGGHAELIWSVPTGTIKLTVNLAPDDALAADNSASLLLPAPARYRVAVAAAHAALYERVLEGIPGLSVTTAMTASADLSILEGAEASRTANQVTGSLLLVNPSGPAWPARDVMTDARSVTVVEHPILAGVDLHALQVRHATVLSATPGLLPLVSTPAGPLLLAGERAGRRVALLAFDPRDSNLPGLAAFPLLMANLVEWLDPLVGAEAVVPGTAVRLPPGALVTTPAGQTTAVGPEGIFPATDAAGLYRVARPARPDLLFAVNQTDAAETDLAPRPHPEWTSAAAAPVSHTGSAQEVWQPLAAVALTLLGAEWFLYCWKRGQM